MNGAKRSSLGLVFSIVFLDVVGFSVIFPLFPAMLSHYVALEGETGWCGELVHGLAGLVGEEVSFAPGAPSVPARVIALFGGVLGSLYSILQFVFAPVWGVLSDRSGRRPVLLLTLTGTAVSYLLWVFAGSFGLLVSARLLGGMMAGNISTASAVVADTTSGRERAKGMGIIGMAIGLGFVLGPALGGIAALLTPEAETWRRGLALNPFSGPALVSLVLALINLIWTRSRLEETLAPALRGRGERGATWNPFGRLRDAARPGVTRTTLVYFFYTTAFAGMEFTLTFLAVERLGYSVQDNTAMFVFVGLVIAFVNGALVRRLAPRFGEQRLALSGLALLLPGFLAIASAHSTGALYAGLFAMAVGSALAMPSLSALVSRYAPVERQGLVLGAFRSLGSLSRAIGPLLGGLLYWTFGSAAPYYAGAAFLLLPLALAVRLPPLPEVEPG